MNNPIINLLEMAKDDDFVRYSQEVIDYILKRRLEINDVKQRKRKKQSSEARKRATSLRDERVLAWCEKNLKEGDIVTLTGARAGRKIRKMEFYDTKYYGSGVDHGRGGRLEGFQVIFIPKYEDPHGMKTRGKLLGYDFRETGIMTQNDVSKVVDLYRLNEDTGLYERFVVNDLAKLSKISNKETT